MTTSVEVNFVRSWSGQKDEQGRPHYEPIGGFASDPLNIAIRTGLHKQPPKANTKQEGDNNG